MPEFKTYQQQVVKTQKVVRRVNKKDFKLVSNGTDNHLLLITLQTKYYRKEAEALLGKVGITVNKTQYHLIGKVLL